MDGGIATEGGDAEVFQELLQRLRAAEGIELAEGGDVERTGQRGAESDGAAVVAVVIFRQIEALRGAERAGDVGEDRGGNAVVALEGEQVGEGFERGARRARNERAVELAAARVGPVGGGNEGEDFPGRVVDGDEGGVTEVRLAESGGFLADDGFEVALERKVEGGADWRLEI